MTQCSLHLYWLDQALPHHGPVCHDSVFWYLGRLQDPTYREQACFKLISFTALTKRCTPSVLSRD